MIQSRWGQSRWGQFCGILTAMAVFCTAAPALAAEAILEQHGKASYYGDALNRKKTASGAIYNRNELTAASPTLPLGTTAKVTNEATGKSVEVRVTDRGPHKRGRIIDVSNSAARELDMKRSGVARVKVEATPSHQKTSQLKRDIAARANHQQLAKAK